MKRFALSALVMTALACPALGDDELAGDIAPPEAEFVVEEFVVEEDVVAEADSEGVPTDDLEFSEPGKEGEFPSDDAVRVTTDLEDGYVLRTLTTTDGTEEVNPEIYYTMSPGGGTVSDVSGAADASLSVNQLADEQRASLRLFSGRETGTERRGGASSLKELFASRSRSAAGAEARTATLSPTEREAARRKAEVDQLRDEALRTGDAALLARADALAAAQAKGNVKGKSFFGFGRR
jgi:hypothetical protein